MNEPKFTPGPLTAQEETPGGAWSVRDEWGNATAWSNPGHFRAETWKANMQLYAVAPEMYELLVKIERVNRVCYEYLSLEDKEAFNAICNVLDKVRGES